MDLFIQFFVVFVRVLAELLSWVLFIHVILSWFSTGRTPFGAWLDAIVRPLLKPFRWARWGMFDFSVIVAFLILQYGTPLLINTVLKFSETV